MAADTCQKFSLTARIVNFVTVARLDDSDLLGELEPAVQERDETIVKTINLLPELGQARHSFLQAAQAQHQETERPRRRSIPAD